jgi:hypothetical protein
MHAEVNSLLNSANDRHFAVYNTLYHCFMSENIKINLRNTGNFPAVSCVCENFVFHNKGILQAADFREQNAEKVSLS